MARPLALALVAVLAGSGVLAERHAPAAGTSNVAAVAEERNSMHHKHQLVQLHSKGSSARLGQRPDKRQTWDEPETSRLQIQIPRELFKAEGYAHKEALFGIPVYGGFIAEKLYYSSSTFLCSAPTADEVKAWQSPFILMADRGNCTFVTKVRHAQHAGASGVLVADNVCLCSDDACTSEAGKSCEQVEPIMADDGSGADITIPSFLLYKPDADKIKAELKKEHSVQVEMTWSMPAPDDRVEWSLWTSSNDTSSLNLKMDFYDMMKALGKHQYFTPYYQVYDGEAYNCRAYPDHCGSLCTNDGRYCMPDPDRDPYHGFSGKDIIVENLRQKCIWNHYGGDKAVNQQTEEGVGLKWWQYVRDFHTTCSVTGKFTDGPCIAGVMKKAGIEQKVIDQCMEDSGGVDSAVNNQILDSELQEKIKKSIVIVPSVYVNNVVQRGGLSAANVLSSICAGYLEGTQPEVCGCVSATPDQVVACVKSGNYHPLPPGTKVVQGVSVGGVIAIVSLMAVAMTIAGFVYWKRTQEQMREQVRSILAEYMPLEDAGDGDGSGGMDGFSNGRTAGRFYDLNSRGNGGVQV